MAWCRVRVSILACIAVLSLTVAATAQTTSSTT
jgi:hypothetical protein